MGIDSTRSFDLTGKVAVVTGGSGNLGPVWAEALLEHGATVALLDLAPADRSPRFQELAARFGVTRLLGLLADVTDRDSLLRARDDCARELGPPSILVNNAGIDQPPGGVARRFSLEEIPADVCRRVLEVNVLGLFQATQVFLEPLSQTRGSIINIGSLYAGVSPDARYYDHLPGAVPFLKPPMYGASKAAVVNLTRYLATHLAPRGVRVNTLSPGGVAGNQDPEFLRKFTARVPLGRMARFEDLKGPLVFLAADASQYVTGIELKVDGGYCAW